ncbi:MAG TPA: hypothetical protein VMU48_11150 [Terracidiphilus sp.]|nr:hypothetical protein [Terracidiphilus sp.]
MRKPKAADRFGPNSIAHSACVTADGDRRPDRFRVMWLCPGYFQTMGIDRIAGRDFASETANSLKVAVVNETFVKQFFGGRNATGQRVTERFRDAANIPSELQPIWKLRHF